MQILKHVHGAASRRCTLLAVLTAILLSTSGCDQAKGLLDTLRGGSVPSEIADACVTLSVAGGEWKYRHGFKLNEIAKAMEGSQAKDVKWERSPNGYIWRWAIPNQLQNRSNTIAIEFAIQDPREKPPYAQGECGPMLVQAVAALYNGVPIPVGTLTRTFYNLTQPMLDARKAAQGVADDAPDEAPVDNQQTPALPTSAVTPVMPIDQRWLLGTWGPAEYNPDNNPKAGCDTDSIVTFQSDGSYRDGGSYGRFRTDGRSITYFERVMYDDIAGTTDRSQFNNPLTNQVERVDGTSMREQGQLLRRCNG